VKGLLEGAQVHCISVELHSRALTPEKWAVKGGRLLWFESPRDRPRRIDRKSQFPCEYQDFAEFDGNSDWGNRAKLTLIRNLLG